MERSRDNGGGADDTPATRRRRDRTVGRDEAELWRRATADVTPMRPVDPAATPPAPLIGTDLSRRDEPAKPTQPPPTRRGLPAAPPPLTPPSRMAAGLDRRTLTRLRRGQVVPEQRIDLHNCTQAEAHRRLDLFLAQAADAGRRCVLVITGKGYRPDGSAGVLKTMVPRWLDEPSNRERVLAVSPAAPSHGGEGALYVLLRRRRERRG